MSWTKRQFVEAALEEIGMASYVFDMTSQELQSSCRRLDAMMADWNSKGLRLSYPLPGSPEDTDLDTETAVPDMANEAIITNLAIRLSASYGKQLMPQTAGVARRAYANLLSRFACPPEQQLPSTMPSGAGNKPWRWDDPFLEEPLDPVDVGPDSELEFY